MRICNYDLLEYLHDAMFVSLIFFLDDGGLRRCRLVVSCDEDCGYDAWAGRVLELLFLDVLLCSGSLLGHTVGPEHINSISEGLTQGAQESVADMVAHGVGRPETQLTILLQSGSELALACSGVEVSVQG